MRPVPNEAVDLVKRWEACKLKAYPDPATGGDPWTIGWGHAVGVRPGQVITQAQADKFLMADLGVAAERLWGQIGAVVEELTDNQYAALLSFVFNLGVDPKWTIWKRLKARQFELVPNELNRFVYANGKRMQGLANRRASEVALWRTGEPGTHDDDVPSSITRLADTSPVATDVAPKKSATLWGSIVAAVSGFLVWAKDMLMQAPDFVQSALNAVNPFAQKSELAQMIVNGLGAFGAVAAVLVTLQVFKAKRDGQR